MPRSTYRVPQEYPRDADGKRLRGEDGVEVRVTGRAVLMAILKHAWPDREDLVHGYEGVNVDGVRIKTVAVAYRYGTGRAGRRSGYALDNSPLGGVELRVPLGYRYGSHDPMRRVMVKADRTLDLEALRAKHEELLAVKAEEEARFEAADQERARQAALVDEAYEKAGIARSWNTPFSAVWSGEKEGVLWAIDFGKRLTEPEMLVVKDVLEKLGLVDESGNYPEAVE